MTASDKNLSTEYQPRGSARNPSDTLDRPGAERDASEAPATIQNATVRRGGEAAGGIAPHPGDPTSPAEADQRAADRDAAQQRRGLGDDGPRSTDGS